MIRILSTPLVVLGGAATLLVGCQSEGDRAIARAGRQDTCGVKALRAFVGHKADPATRDAIERGRRVRWIVPGEDILANLDTGRINVVLDGAGTIKGVGCY